MSNTHIHPTFSQQDLHFMAQAIALAEEGLNTTTPNPRVGCVIVKADSIVGRGAHLKAGEPHAEVFALSDAGALSQGATAYVTLEPCSHHGKTPPCADALIAAGISRVVIAMQDPNPLVAGRGIARLQAQHIDVQVGCLMTQSMALNAGFIKRMTQGMPYVRSKIAASLDGKTALQNGQSQWITGEAARLDVQHWRAQSCAIITGIGTVLADDPLMNVRLANTQRQPMRIIIDRHLQTPVHAKLLHHVDADHPVMIVYAKSEPQAIARLTNTGATLLALPTSDGTQVDLTALMSMLAQQGLNEILLEAGSGLNSAFMQAGLIDAYILYYAPKWMGHEARPMVELPMITSMNAIPSLTITDIKLIGEDVRIVAIKSALE